MAENEENFKVGKIRKSEDQYFEKKKRFHLLKEHLHQTGKAENMLVVLGRLILFFQSCEPTLGS